MLALCRRPYPLHFPPGPQIRTLRTFPREIPTYIKRWNPTLQRLGPTGPAARDSLPRVTEGENPGLKQQLAIRRLNKLLDQAREAVGMTEDLRMRLKKAYAKAELADPTLRERVPERTLDIFKLSQSAAPPTTGNSDVGHSAPPPESTLSATKYNSIDQWFQYMEGLSLSNNDDAYDEAHTAWTADIFGLSKSSGNDHARYLELGARLHAAAGNLRRARRCMRKLFSLYPSWDTSVMMVVFRAHTTSAMPRDYKCARSIRYSMHVQATKSDMVTIEDYDGWLVGFLEAGNLKLARKVFRNMLKDGYLDPLGSVEDVGKVLERLHMLYRLGSNVDGMTRIALDALNLLPPAYHGFIYGDWMKSAVVQKAPEASAQILDVIIRRGYLPETIHLNMLLRTLMRTGSEANILKAENIAWNMVEETRKRSLNHKLTPDPPPVQIYKQLQNPQMLGTQLEQSNKLPAANSTTFALLMQHHARKLQWEYVDYLARQLRTSGTRPNSAMLNVLIDNKTRKGDYAAAWSTYLDLTKPSDDGSWEAVFPDGATFRHLWKMLRFSLGDYATRDDARMPSPRQLMKEMAEWWSRCRSRPDADRFRLGAVGPDGGALTPLIMHCFSYTQDLAGSLVSMHILQSFFNIYPNDKVAEILIRQMSWVDLSREQDTVREQYWHSRSNTRNRARVEQVYTVLAKRRLAAMHRNNFDVEGCSAEEAGEMGLNLLSEFIRVMLKRDQPEEVVELMIEAAKVSIGLPDLNTGDMDAFEVP